MSDIGGMGEVSGPKPPDRPQAQVPENALTEHEKANPNLTEFELQQLAAYQKLQAGYRSSEGGSPAGIETNKLFETIASAASSAGMGSAVKAILKRRSLLPARKLLVPITIDDQKITHPYQLLAAAEPLRALGQGDVVNFRRLADNIESLTFETAVQYDAVFFSFTEFDLGNLARMARLGQLQSGAFGVLESATKQEEINFYTSLVQSFDYSKDPPSLIDGTKKILHNKLAAPSSYEQQRMIGAFMNNEHWKSVLEREGLIETYDGRYCFSEFRNNTVRTDRQLETTFKLSELFNNEGAISKDGDPKIEFPDFPGFDGDAKITSLKELSYAYRLLTATSSKQMAGGGHIFTSILRMQQHGKPSKASVQESMDRFTDALYERFKDQIEASKIDD